MAQPTNSNAWIRPDIAFAMTRIGGVQGLAVSSFDNWLHVRHPLVDEKIPIRKADEIPNYLRKW